VSITFLGGWSFSRSGVRVPNLVLKSPHTTDVSWGWMCSRTFSSCSVASVSVMSLRASEDVGGRYTLTTFIRSLVGSMNFVNYPYSFPSECSS
jgi:hypothetical protein